MSEITLKLALSRRRTVRDYSDAPVSLEVVRRLLWAAQGITDSEGGRTAPSAHAVHPVRLHLVANRVLGLDRGHYEVDPSDNELKKLSDVDLRSALTDAAIGDPQSISDAACIVIICGDMLTPTRMFSDQKPYGLRGARYVYMEAGAVSQNLQLQAVAEGLGSVCIGGFDDEATANVLGLQDPLAPIMQVCVGYPMISD